MVGNCCEDGAQDEGCLARSCDGLFIASELGHFTVVNGNEISSSAPRFGVKPQIHIFHKSDVLL